MKNNKKYQPTESELEVLQVLWDKGSATVREVHDILERQKDIGYTSTLKTMQIMTEKGLLTRNTNSRKHIYTPAISRETTQGQFLGKMIDNLYSGSTAKLVIGALGHEKLSKKDLEAIQDYLNRFGDNTQ